MKEKYLAIMEKAVGAYGSGRIEKYIAQVVNGGLREHGFPRLTANIGILLAHGRRRDLKEIFAQMMDICCEQIPAALEREPGGVGNEFSVKEITLCLLALEKAGLFPASTTEMWRSRLKTIQPYTCYSTIARTAAEKPGNWVAFCAASEQARVYAGIGGESDFIDTQVASQLLSFDENGMYRDPNEPMVYDVTTRLQLSAVLYFGYNGKYREELDTVLAKGGLSTLLMQSVTGEIPFGGRSNQFLHNEAVLAAVMEFEAARYHKYGDMVRAGQFKAAAVMARDAVCRYLDAEELHHVKNAYPQDSFYGCEKYAYFDKYMVTAGSFAYLAWLFADDTVLPSECPAGTGQHIFQTSPYFHKTILKYGTYYAEYDTNADFHYDANGLGRIHRQGAPSAICISVPFAVNPLYRLDVENAVPASVCWGVREGEDYLFSSEKGTEYKLSDSAVTDTGVSVKWQCCLTDGHKASESCSVTKNGISLCYESTDEICCLLPVFAFDGEQKTQTEEKENCLTVYYRGWRCRYTLNTVLRDSGKVLANRNGHYRAFLAEGRKRIEITIVIEPDSSTNQFIGIQQI